MPSNHRIHQQRSLLGLFPEAREGEGLEGKRGGEEAPASSSMFQAILSSSASIKAEGFEEVARKNSPHTLQGEEGQEESQHPDTVQPVGPHASLSLAPLPLPFSPSLRFSLSLSQFIFFFFFPSSLLSKKMGFVSPFSPSGLCFASSDNPVAAQADPRWPDSQITSHSPLQLLEKGGARLDAPP